LENDSDQRDFEEVAGDPPMSEFHRAMLASLRQIFGWPYLVCKVKDGIVNDTGLSWNPDFWVEKDSRKILVIGVLDPETTPADLDVRMREAFAIMALNWFYQDKIALSAPNSVLIIPSDVSKELTDKQYLTYHYMFENVQCQIVRQPHLLEMLELYRDDEDRKRHPMDAA
jgi:hypothetical protein